MYKFSANVAFYQLRMARPQVARRNETELRALLEEVSNAVINRYRDAKPKSTILYLGTVGSRGVALRLDADGRINADWVEIPRLMRSYESRNNLWTVIAANQSPALTA